MRTVLLRLTPYEADTLQAVMGNGIDDGMLFVNDDGSATGYGDGKRSLAAYQRVDNKLRHAREGATKWTPSRADAVYEALGDLFDGIVQYVGLGGELVPCDLLAAGRLLGRVRDAKEALRTTADTSTGQET